MVDFPVSARPAKILFLVIRLFLQTRMVVESTKEIPVQVPIQQVLAKIAIGLLNIENVKMLKCPEATQMKQQCDCYNFRGTHLGRAFRLVAYKENRGLFLKIFTKLIYNTKYFCNFIEAKHKAKFDYIINIEL